MKLNELEIGRSGTVKSVGGEGALRQHILDMGVIPGASVTLIKYAPMGDPMEVRIHGYELTLRVADAMNIQIDPLETGEASGAGDKDFDRAPGRRKRVYHPGLGEEGKFHPKGSGDPLPGGTTLTFALMGNQNSGKTTLFNQLTGSNQHVGNFPGVTVDRKDGVIRGYKDTLITDLPGIYSMSPYSGEELVSRNFVLGENGEKPRGIINIVDATNIERNLYLTMQLLEMEIPMVVALNMMDEVTGNGGVIDINAMEDMLGTPVVPISAAKGQGINELVKHAIHVARYQEAPIQQDFCGQDDHGGAVHRCLHAVKHLIEDHAKAAGIPARFAADKVVEGDEHIMKSLGLDDNELEALEHIIFQMENERGLDRNAAMADMRFSFIEKVAGRCIRKPFESREHIKSQKLDRILTGKYTAIPMFIGIMALVFYLTFNVIGAFLQDLMGTGIGMLTDRVHGAMVAAGVNPVVISMVIGGLFEGVGSVLSFLPIIVVMFFFLSILEDSGYIARVAFFMDRLLRKLGLSGRSIVPLLIGFGCTVPAVMSTRTLPSERDRKMTILLTPFMSCTAKLPIYGFFISAFFPGKGGIVMTALYALGIVVGILVALLFKNTLFKGEAVPFIMELPNYRLPSLRNTLQLLWDKARDFLQRAFSIILVATLVVWFLKTFDLHLDIVANSGDSILAAISGVLVPLFRPLGLGDWRVVTSLINGFLAKEGVVSVLRVLFDGAGGVAGAMGLASAVPLLVFSLLYTPCVAAVASVKRELGFKWAAGVVIWQCTIAWLAAYAARWICVLMGLG